MRQALYVLCIILAQNAQDYSAKFLALIDQISVDSVRPLYGPLAGGTRVSITGQNVNVNTARAVYFGQHKGHLDTNRLSSSLFLIITGISPLAFNGIVIFVAI